MFTTPGDLLGGDPEVVISTRSALEATAIADRRTLRPSSALEVFDEKTSIMYFPGEVVVVELVHGELRVTDRIKGVGQRVQCVPFAWDRTVSKPFGRSRISRPVMDYSGMAVRTMLRQEVQAEHLSSPQRVLEGARESAFIDAKGDKKSMWDIATGSIWGIPDFYDEESGEWRRANLKQLAAASQQPHTDQLKTIAMMFSGATDIPIGQLGIIQDNPSSAEAIRMAESAMVNTVTMQLPSYEDARLELAVNVLGAAHGLSASLEAEVRKVRPTFMEPGTTTPGAQADRAQKFIAANPWAAQSEVALELWGFTASQVSRLRDEMKRQAGASLVRQILGQAPAD